MVMGGVVVAGMGGAGHEIALKDQSSPVGIL